MINQIAAEKSFYFSYNYDLTKTIQENLSDSIQNNDKEKSIETDYCNAFPKSTNYQSKFAFNHYLLNEFKQPHYCPFRVPVIYGFLYLRTLPIEQNKFDFALISRKDCRRPGKRFIVRGLDREGHAANYVESEHVITIYDSP